MMKSKLNFKNLALICTTVLLLFYSCEEDEQFKSQTSTNTEFFVDASATEISEDMAELAALNFITKTNEKSKKSYKIKSTKKIKDYNGDIAVYDINFEPEGFTLVSSNKKNIPIIAYSDNGSFDLNEDSPDGLKSWLAMTIIINNELEKLENPSKAIEEDEWSDLPDDDDDDEVVYSHTVRQQYGPLLQTAWRQWPPYNYYTNNCPTGCVAVAMAQVMRYHQWPNTFDWSIMPNVASGTSAGSLEIARLMAGIGKKVDMDYTLYDGSGAEPSKIRDALVNNYQYSSEAYYSGYSFNTTKYEIKANRPVIMGGHHTYYTTTSGWWIFEKTAHHYEES